MEATFRLYRRGRKYYCQHNETGQQESSRTCDKAAATIIMPRHSASATANTLRSSSSVKGLRGEFVGRGGLLTCLTTFSSRTPRLASGKSIGLQPKVLPFQPQLPASTSVKFK
jgi:hypothetical protein